MTAKSVPQQSRGKVAVIEEKSDNIYSLRFILQSLGYELLSIQRDEPLDTQILSFQPRVVLIDMLIPENEGLRILKTLKKLALEDTVFVAITADVVDISIEELKAAGFDAVLKKPFSVGEMQKVLNG